MKKILFFASAVALLAGCSRELTEDVVVPVIKGNNIIMASYESDAETRAYFDVSGTPSMGWDRADALGVISIDGRGNKSFGYVEAAGEGKGKFQGDLMTVPGNEFYLYYPMQSEAPYKVNTVGTTKEHTFTLTIPSTQTYGFKHAGDKAEDGNVYGSFTSGVVPVVAKAEVPANEEKESDTQLETMLYPVASYLSFPIKGHGTIKTVELTVQDQDGENVSLAGDVTVVMNKENVEEWNDGQAKSRTVYFTAKPSEEGDTTITLDCVDGVKLEGDTKYFMFAVNPGFELGGLTYTLKVYGSKETTKEFKYSLPATVKNKVPRNGVQRLNTKEENIFEWIETAEESFLIHTASDFVEYAYAATYGVEYVVELLNGETHDMIDYGTKSLKSAVIVNDLTGENAIDKIDVNVYHNAYTGKDGQFKEAVFYEWYQKNGNGIETIGGKENYVIIGNVAGKPAVIEGLNVKGNGVFVASWKVDNGLGNEVKNITLKNAKVTTDAKNAYFVADNLWAFGEKGDGLDKIVLEGCTLEAKNAGSTALLNIMQSGWIEKFPIEYGEELPATIKYVANEFDVFTSKDVNVGEKFFGETVKVNGMDVTPVLFGAVVPQDNDEKDNGAILTVPNAPAAKGLIAAISTDGTKYGNYSSSAWFSVVTRDENEKILTSYWTGLTAPKSATTSGTKEDKTVITAEELAGYVKYRGKVTLTNDIYLGYDTEWSAPTTSSAVTIDGTTTSKYKILGATLGKNGLFGRNATVKNLTVESVYVADVAEPFVLAYTGTAENVSLSNINYENVKTAKLAGGLFYEGTMDQVVATKDCSFKLKENRPLADGIAFGALYAKVNVALGYDYTVPAYTSNEVPFAYLYCSGANTGVDNNTDIRFPAAIEGYKAENVVRWAGFDISPKHRVTFFFGNDIDYNNVKQFADDFTLAKDETVDNLEFAKNGTIDLNGNKLTVNAEDEIVLENKNKMVIENGTLAFTKSKNKLDINVKAGATLEINNVTITSNDAGIRAQAEGANLTITKSKITSRLYCYNTNANDSDGDGKYDQGSGANVKFVDTEFTSKDATAVLCNVPVNITAEDCIFNGVEQAVFIRVGTDTFKNTTFNLKKAYTDITYRMSQWEDGTKATLAALVVGNYDKKEYANGKKPSYNDPAKVELTGTTTINVTTTSSRSACPAIHVAAANSNYVNFNYVENNVKINSYNYTLGKNKIEFATWGIYVNGSIVEPNCE